MREINLIPSDFVPSKRLTKILKKVRSVLLVALTILIVGSVASLVVVKLLNNKEDGLKSEQSDLETQIEALKETETKLVLIEDRLTKIKSIQDSDIISPKIEKYQKLINGIPDNAIVTDLKIDDMESQTSFFAPDLDTVTKLLAKVLSDDDYTQVVLTDFSFTSSTGYSLSLGLN